MSYNQPPSYNTTPGYNTTSGYTQPTYGGNAQVEHEQQILHDKGAEAIEAVRRLRQGEVRPGIPTTDSITSKIEHAEVALDHLQTGPRGQQMGPKSQQVVRDLKQVLEDEKRFVQEKNAGDLLQSMLRHAQALTSDMSSDPSFGSLFENWRGVISSADTRGDFKELFQGGGELLKNLRDTEAFLELVSELLNMTKILIAERSERITEGQASAAYDQQKAEERERLMAGLRRMMATLSQNQTWNFLIERGRSLAGTVHSTGQMSTETSRNTVSQVMENPHFQGLIADIKLILQRLVGGRMDVDPLVESAKATVRDIANDEQLSSLLYNMQDLLTQMSNNPALADDPTVRERLRLLSRRADVAIQDLKNNPNLLRTKEESHRLLEALRTDPVNAQLAQDFSKLWRDIRSDQPGEVIDHELLRDLRQMIVPLFLEHLSNVPVPPVHGVSGKTSYSLDNIHISVPSLLPNNVHVKFEHELDAELVNLSAHGQRTFLYLQASDIQIHLRNVHWTYNRHGHIHMQDSGYANVDTQGHGVTLGLKMQIRSDTTSGTVLDMLEAHCNLDRFSVKVVDSKHDKLYETLTHMFSGRIRTDVQRAIEEKLRSFVPFFNQKLLVLIEQGKQRSHQYAETARQRGGTTKTSLLGTMDKLKTHGHGLKENEHAKESSKSLVGLAAEAAQHIIDQQQQKIEQKKLEKQQERPLGSGLTTEAQFAHTPTQSVGTGAPFTQSSYEGSYVPPVTSSYGQDYSAPVPLTKQGNTYTTATTPFDQSHQFQPSSGPVPLHPGYNSFAQTSPAPASNPSTLQTPLSQAPPIANLYTTVPPTYPQGQ